LKNINEREENMNIQNKETAIQDEQQLKEINTIQTLSNIELHLKSIADSLDKIAEKGLDTFSRCSSTNY